MKQRTSLIYGVFATVIALTSIGCHTAKKPSETSAHPSAGVVRGVVKFEGDPPRRKVIDVSRDSKLEKARGDKPLLDGTLIVGTDGGVADALVFVSAGTSDEKPPQDTAPAVFEVIGSEYVPHVRGIVAGQTVRFISQDDVMHNVRCDSQKNSKFNVAQLRRGGSFDRVFRNSELGISIRCDIHPWEGAVLHVLRNRFFAVTRADGSFKITGLPPGEYELTVVHAYDLIAADVPSVKVSITSNRGAEALFIYRSSQQTRN